MIVDTLFCLLLIASGSFSAESFACAGIAVIGYSGYLNDKKIYDKKKEESVDEFNFTKGVLTAVLVRITGSAIFDVSPSKYYSHVRFRQKIE